MIDRIKDDVSVDITRRLSTINGHVNGIIKMVDEGRECEDILMQLSAVESSLKNVMKKIFVGHVSHCIREAVKAGDMQKLDELVELTERYV